MFYEGVGEDGRSAFGLAVSDDGTMRERRCLELILEAAPDKGAWGAGRVGSTCAIGMAYGKWRLYSSERQQPGSMEINGLAITAITADGEHAEFEGIKLSFKRRAPS